MDTDELRCVIQSAANYLLDQQTRLKRGDRYFYEEQGCAAFLAKLDSAGSGLQAAVKHLQALRTRFEFGEMDKFSSVDGRVRKAYDQALDAMVEIQITRHQTRIEHPPKTRGLYLQKSAARLAWAYVGDRVRGQARSVALEILTKANLPAPSDGALTRWFQEFRKEDA